MMRIFWHVRVCAVNPRLVFGIADWLYACFLGQVKFGKYVLSDTGLSRLWVSR